MPLAISVIIGVAIFLLVLVSIGLLLVAVRTPEYGRRGPEEYILSGFSLIVLLLSVTLAYLFASDVLRLF